MLEREITNVIVGQPVLVRRLLTALFASIPYSYTRSETRSGCGHVLLEGVPGVAKTLTVTTLAHAISARYQRIQLTPDMLPADIVGTRIYDATTATFRTEQGPVFTNILLADEINRATPKTQSALLEAMQERQVTLADTTYRLDDPFWVLATQNPVEQEGVYVLPEAQLDRFSMMLRVEYPTPADEMRMLRNTNRRVELEKRITLADVVQIRDLIVEVVHIDRSHQGIHHPARLGDAGPGAIRPAGAAGDADAGNLAALLPAHRRPGPGHRISAWPDLRAPRRPAGDSVRRDPAPARPQRARRCRARARRRDRRRDPGGRADPVMMAGLHCTGRRARSGVVRS